MLSVRGWLGNCGLREFLCLVGILWAGFGRSASGTEVPSVEEPDFAGDVYPLLQRFCFECHGRDRDEAGLRLDSAAELMAGGVVQPESAEESELIRRIGLPVGHADRMPPVGEGLDREQVVTLTRWVDRGANWPESFEAPPHWAYQPPRRVPIPDVGDPFASAGASTSVGGHEEMGRIGVESPSSAIDRWVRQRLPEQGLQPASPAAPESLVRRLHFDLIGLPPSPAAVARFVADPSEAAYQRLVDGLLANPQFGERWARHWLDLARYADSHGFQRDDLRDLWAYRDWVIRAINEDMPFDRFTIEQLAGDLLPGAGPSERIATGFHRCAPTNVEAGSIPEETRVMQLIDRVNTTATVWLGTTLQCAQCHDHKYDPFGIEEYYRLLAFFNTTEIEADLTSPDKPSSIAFRGPRLVLDPPFGDGQATTLVMAEAERRPTRIFERGDYRNPGELVEPGTPRVLHPLRTEVTEAGGPSPDADRLALARWLVDPANPLVARVIVNRWWGELFGRPLVNTPEDFGAQGDRPTHPELLDDLAIGFVEGGWSMKRVLRRIVTSATYRQSSLSDEEGLRADPDNRWLSRGPRFRLDAEMIRDNALAIAGSLDHEMFGPPIRPPQPAGLWTKVGGERYDYQVSEAGHPYRRGIYIVIKRGSPYPSLINFDAPNRLDCTVRRGRTATPLQALTLLNDPVFVGLARAMAAQAVARSDGEPTRIIEEWFLRCTARPPTESEREVLVDLFEAQRQAATGRAEPGIESDETFGPLDAKQRADYSAWYSVATTLLNLHETVVKP